MEALEEKKEQAEEISTDNIIEHLKDRINYFKIIKDARSVLLINTFILYVAFASIGSYYNVDNKNLLTSNILDESHLKINNFKNVWLNAVNVLSGAHIGSKIGSKIGNKLNPNIVLYNQINTIINYLIICLFVIGNNLMFASLNSEILTDNDILITVYLTLGYHHCIRLLLDRYSQQEYRDTLLSIVKLKNETIDQYVEIQEQHLMIEHFRSQLSDDEDEEYVEDDEEYVEDDEEYVEDDEEEDELFDIDDEEYTPYISTHVNDIIDLATAKIIINDEEDTYKLQKKIEIQKDSVNCIICFESYITGDDIVSLKCEHHYHSKCLKTWAERKTSCPVCKRDLIYDTEVPEDDEEELPDNHLEDDSDSSDIVEDDDDDDDDADSDV